MFFVKQKTAYELRISDWSSDVCSSDLFCAVDLSAFYFDIRKDSLYCDAPDAARRRAAQTALDALFDCLTAWLAPILCFTAEEAWLARNGDAPGESVHLRLFPEIPEAWRDDDLAAKWRRVRAVRRVVLGALEIERAEKRIGSSLQAAPEVYVTGEDAVALAGVDLAEVTITSDLSLRTGEPPADAFTIPDAPGIGVLPRPAEGEKCARCRRASGRATWRESVGQVVEVAVVGGSFKKK